MQAYLQGELVSLPATLSSESAQESIYAVKIIVEVAFYMHGISRLRSLGCVSLLSNRLGVNSLF